MIGFIIFGIFICVIALIGNIITYKKHKNTTSLIWIIIMIGCIMLNINSLYNYIVTIN